ERAAAGAGRGDRKAARRQRRHGRAGARVQLADERLRAADDVRGDPVGDARLAKTEAREEPRPQHARTPARPSPAAWSQLALAMPAESALESDARAVGNRAAATAPTDPMPTTPPSD